MFDPRHSDLGREDIRRVLVSIGKPMPTRSLSGSLANVPTRTLMLAALLGLVMVCGLVGLARGEEAGRAGERGAIGERVKKGPGGLGAYEIPPLEKLKNFGDLSAPSLYNFLQIPVGLSSAPLPSPAAPFRSTSPATIKRQAKIAGLLAFFILIVLWLHLRSTRADRGAW